MPEKQVDIILGVKFDRVSGSQTQTEIANLKRSVESIGDSVKRTADVTDDYGPLARASIESVRVGFDSLHNNVEEVDTSIEELNADIKKLDDLDVKPKIEVQQTTTGSSRGSGGIGDVRTAAQRAGAAVSFLGGGKEVTAAAQVLQLVETLGPLGIVAGVASIAIGKVTDELERQRAAQQAYFDSVATVTDLLFSGATSEDVQRAKTAAEQQRDSIQAQIDQYQPLIDAYDNARIGTGEFADAVEAIKTQTGGNIDGLRQKNEQLQTQLEGTNNTIGELNTLLTSNSIIRDNDTKAAEQARTDNLDAAASSKALHDAMRDLYGVAPQVTDAFNDMLNMFTDGVNDVGARIWDGFNGIVTNVADGITAVTSGAEEFGRELGKVDKAIEAVNAEEARHANAVTSITEKAHDKELEILSDANDRAVKLGEDYGIDKIHAQEDLARELARIDRDFAKSSRDAAASLDANALQDAIEKRQEDRADAKEQTDVETKRKKEAYERQIKDLADSTKKQLDINRKTASDALRIENDKYTAEIAARQRALAVAQAYFRAYVASVTQTQVAVAGATSGFVSYMINQANRLRAAASVEPVSVPGTGSIHPQVPISYAVGTRYVPRDMIAQIHRGEMIIPARQAAAIRSGASGGSSRPITINVNEARTPALTAAALKPMLIQVLREEAGE